MRGLQGKVAIVTGAATLIGVKAAEAFVNAGVKVVMADINEADGKAAAVKIGDHARFCKTDITQDGDIDACLSFTEKTFGRVDFLVNIASTYLDNGIQSTRDEWLTSLNINLVGGAIFTQKARPYMVKQGGGAVVNFASISGKRAQPGRLLYSAAKAAIIQVSRNVAMQLTGDKIRVNSVSPGWTWSNIMVQLTKNNRKKADAVAAPFHYPGRMGDPEEVANAVLFLCSDEASFINGTDLAVDGGYTAMGPEQMTDAVSKLMS
jgi:hypothetical protein